jgi:Tol biopolymer transport system component
MLYRDGFKSANLLKVSLVTTAVMLAIWLLAFAETTNTAGANSLPKNGKIAFSRLQEGQGFDIYSVDPDGSSLRQLTNNVKWADHPAWSPDGTKIAFGSLGHIRVMGADGSNLRRLTPIKSEVPYSGPSWLPDGTKLAFIMKNDPKVYGSDIYTMDVDGSNITRITNSPKISKGSIDISPDGSQMCLNRISDEPPEKPGIYVMSVDASNPTQLTTSRERAGDCSWSPDATKIAYQVVPAGLAGPDLSRAEVYVMNADGSGNTNLTNSRGGDAWPEWSPDGTKIAFSSSRDGDFDIYTMDADGSDVTQVTNLRGDQQYPDWQPLPGTTVHQPDTGGPSLLLVAIALLFSSGVLFYAGLKRRV